MPSIEAILKLTQSCFIDATNMAVAITGRHFHDFTAASVGIEADSYNGGLRKDLTYYLEQNKNPASAWATGWKS
ncbi:hypothetical protein, partial [Klebsiella pneumoniae]|uniref:hypothetical protein n=1 Tax=Klebsiella pneumoniae TaxID=573 RepID=UPI0032189B91